MSQISNVTNPAHAQATVPDTHSCDFKDALRNAVNADVGSVRNIPNDPHLTETSPAGTSAPSGDAASSRVTTMALGEEGSCDGGGMTTMAVGEEGGDVTTMALGEEGAGGGGGMTTLAVGEEGGDDGGHVTTLAVGEEGGALV